METTVSRITPQAPRARRDYIDALKGLGIILVVLGHFEEYYRGAHPIFNGSFECIYMFHMALFCICSGLVAKFSLRKLICQQLWLYVVCQGALLGFRAIALHEELSGSPVQLLLEPWRHMWYLCALLIWELTVPLLRLLARKAGPVGAVLALAASVAFGLWGGNVDWPYGLGRAVSFYPFYAFGVLFAPQIDRWQQAAARIWQLRLGQGLALAAALAAVYGRWMLSVLNAPEPVFENGRIFQASSYTADGYAMPDRAAFYLVGLLTTLALAGVLGGCRPLAGLGRRTLPIYILHMPTYALLVELGTYAAVNERGLAAELPWVTFAVMGTVCACASAPVCLVMNGVANLWYKTVPGLAGRLLRKNSE